MRKIYTYKDEYRVFLSRYIVLRAEKKTLRNLKLYIRHIHESGTCLYMTSYGCGNSEFTYVTLSMFCSNYYLKICSLITFQH